MSILGIDLGVSSIGWALVENSEEKRSIMGMGSRIIPLSADDKNEFSSGNAISKNQNRTTKRGQRRGYDRYQLRRKYLVEILGKNNMLPEGNLIHLAKLPLWELRCKAATPGTQISLQELGRVLLHLNQKRGYKSARTDDTTDKKNTEYVAAINNRHDKLKESGLTIGQFFYGELLKNDSFRAKKEVYPRQDYIEEYDRILNAQKEFYPDILTEQFTTKVRNEIIYYQRKLKSQKGLVGVCEFEGFKITKDVEGKEKTYFVGPKVAHRSSPLFQVCKIWETINNISIRKKHGDYIEISLDKKLEIFNHLNLKKNLSFTELLKILELRKDEVYGNKQLQKGLQGNTTRAAISDIIGQLSGTDELLSFEPVVELKQALGESINKITGEIQPQKCISAGVEEQPLYKLWHTIYSIPEIDDCRKTLVENFHLPDDSALALAKIDFTKAGFGNKSHRAIRKILPYLMDGFQYSDACAFAGYNHSDSLTKTENQERELSDKLELLLKNSLRQPIVEKILNQLINLYNDIVTEFGKPDEIHIELARELKQSKSERNDTYKAISKLERESKNIESRLAEFGIRSTRNNIIKYRLFNKVDNDEAGLIATCPYCGKPISITAAMLGEDVDVDHIIPRSRYFDDSQSNKVLAHRSCNEAKGNDTAYDFMKKKSADEFDHYIERVNRLYNDAKITKGKRDKLLTPGDSIPQDFIDRQLRETQYISKKAKELLETVCRTVVSTSGQVTAELRHIWGWDDVLMNLQLPKYRELGLTEIIETEKDGQKFKQEKISGWTKRDDHRHHAIDALVIACTSRSIIQRINSLNASSTRDAMLQNIRDAKIQFDKKKSLLENFIYSLRPFTTAEVEKYAANILVSFKAGKKVATLGRRIIKKGGKKIVVQKNVIVPRGALSEDSVYGNIRTLDKNKPLKYLFFNPDLILKEYIRALVLERLAQHQGNASKALASLKKEPIYLDSQKAIELNYATCYKKDFVLRYPITNINRKDAESIVDPRVKAAVIQRLEEHGGNEKEAFSDLEHKPVWLDKDKKLQILHVRCFTGLSAVAPVKKDAAGNDIGFVKPGNNHHLAIYINEEGKKVPHICSFWHAVERKKYGFPVVIKDPAAVADVIIESPEDTYPESFLKKLPEANWKYVESFQQNEMFILGMSQGDIFTAIETENQSLLSNSLYRVQKLFYNGKALEIFFRHHIETELKDDDKSRSARRFIQIQSLGSLELLAPHKVVISRTGNINLK